MQTNTPVLQKSDLLKGALINGGINAVMNGAINWFQSDKTKNVMLTSDLISSTEHTVFSAAVPLAVSLAFILSSITYFTMKGIEKPPYFPKVFMLCLKHSIYAFGLVTITGLLLQRFAGSIEVAPIVATILTGIIAGIVGGVVNYETSKSLISN